VHPSFDHPSVPLGASPRSRVPRRRWRRVPITGAGCRGRFARPGRLRGSAVAPGHDRSSANR
jgi:hypothetical protein